MEKQKHYPAVQAPEHDGLMNLSDISRATVGNSPWFRFIGLRILSSSQNYLVVFFVILMLMSTAPRAHSEDKYGFQIKKDPELQQIRPRKPVKIKLKRTGKNEYIWELTGDDADEIIKTDKKLRRLLNE